MSSFPVIYGDDFCEQERLIENGKLLNATHIIFTYKELIKTKTINNVIYQDGKGIEARFVLPYENLEDVKNKTLIDTPFAWIVKL